MRRKMICRLYALLGVLCLIASIGFASQLLRTRINYRRSEKDLAKIQQIRQLLPQMAPEEELGSMDVASARAIQEENKQIRMETYNILHEENPDVVGWIQIEGTKIDYPVMQTPDDPNYYLHRGFDGKYSAYGMIYLDAGCALDTVCPNYLIYGHHMKNGAMFAQLENYASREFREEHPEIDFSIRGEPNSYQVIGVIRLDASELGKDFTKMLAARTEEDYNSLMEYVKQHSPYDTGITAEWPQQLITLTTCEYTQKDGRLLVVARKKTE